jgi:hypothetical protein
LTGDKVLHFVTGAGLPEPVGAGHVSGYDGIEEFSRGFFLRIKTKPEPYGDDGDDESRRHGKDHGARFFLSIGRRFEK